MAGGKSSCENCGANTSMSGNPVCHICDPDMKAVIRGEVESKTPDLCAACFQRHMDAHEKKVEPQQDQNCPSCGNPGYTDSCFQCGHSPQIG